VRITLNVTLLTYVLALLSGLLIGTISPALIVSRSVTFMITMLHSIMGGALLGVYVRAITNNEYVIPLIIIAVTLGLSVLVAELIERGLAEDTATALSVSIGTTLTIVFSYLASMMSTTAVAEAWSYIMGSSALATANDVIKVYLTLTVVAPFTYIIWRELKYITFDEDGAKSLGINVRFYRYIFYTLIAMVAAVLSSTIGVLVTHAVLAVPGALAMRLSRRNYIALSYVTSELIIVTGYVLARYLGLPPSGGVGLIALASLAILLTKGPES